MDKQLLDIVSNVALVNFYSLGKKDKQIQLIGYNYKNIEHKALFMIALIASRNLQYTINIQANLFKFLYLKWKYRKLTKLSRIKNTNKEVPSCNEFISNITQANNYPNAFIDLYNNYYKETL